MSVVDFKCLFLNQNDDRSPYVVMYSEDTKYGMRYYRVHLFLPCAGKNEKYRIHAKYFRSGSFLMDEPIHQFWGAHVGHSDYRYRYISTSNKDMADDKFQRAYRELTQLYGSDK